MNKEKVVEQSDDDVVGMKCINLEGHEFVITTGKFDGTVTTTGDNCLKGLFVFKFAFVLGMFQFSFL